MAPGRRCNVEVGVGVANVARLESRVGKFPSCPVRLHPNDCEHLHERHKCAAFGRRNFGVDLSIAISTLIS
jgi:hypothetical protein